MDVDAQAVLDNMGTKIGILSTQLAIKEEECKQLHKKVAQYESQERSTLLATTTEGTAA